MKRINTIILRSLLILTLAGFSGSGGLSARASNVQQPGSAVVQAYPNFKLATIVVKFPDTTTMPYIEGTKTPWTREYLESKLFSGGSSMADFYATISGGAMSVSGDIFDNNRAYYTIDLPATIGGYCDWTNFFQDAIRAADPDIDFTKYNSVLILAPQMTCSTGGIATSIIVPDAGQRYYTIEADGPLNATPSHELGHLIGWSHANAWTCDPPGVLTGKNCSEEEYGDRFSVMGLSMTRMLYPAAPQLEKMGWFKDGDVQTVTTDGDYILRPYETDGTLPRVLKIPQERDASGAVTKWYYLEFRRAIGFDNMVRTPTLKELGITSGALVHIGTGAGDGLATTLLDMTPGSNKDHDIFEPTLPIGSSYTDTAAGVSFGVLAAVPTSITIRVAFNSGSLCKRKAPSVTAVAVKKSARPGQQLRYTVTLKNNDVLCGKQTFDLKTAVRPKNWKVTIAGQTTKNVVLKPGEKKKFDVRVTSLRTTRIGTYNIGIEARQRSHPKLKKQLTIKPVVAWR